MEIKDIKKLIKEIKKDYSMDCYPDNVKDCASCEAKVVIAFLERHIEFKEEDLKIELER